MCARIECAAYTCHEYTIVILKQRDIIFHFLMNYSNAHSVDYIRNNRKNRNKCGRLTVLCHLPCSFYHRSLRIKVGNNKGKIPFDSNSMKTKLREWIKNCTLFWPIYSEQRLTIQIDIIFPIAVALTIFDVIHLQNLVMYVYRTNTYQNKWRLALGQFAMLINN